MFNSISWSEFFITVLVLVAAYYVVCGLVLYAKDISGRLKGPHLLNKTSDPDLNAPLMGRIRKDVLGKHEDVVHSQDLVIAPSGPSKILDQSDEGILINSVSHLLREIKVLARVVRESSGPRADATPMFQSLLSNYAHLGGTRFRESITLFVHDVIRQECAFEVALPEIDTWWPDSAQSSNHQKNDI